MLHEILLSLSGHPSPLLRAACQPTSNGNATIDHDTLLTPPERALLVTVAHLSDLHVQLRSATAQISASHPSTVCRAVATAVNSVHLAAFQAKILEVESSILKKDAGLVGAYNIVPLTAVVGEFAGWTRRLEWLWELVQFMVRTESADFRTSSGSLCTGAGLMNRLRVELQTGYVDIEEAAKSLTQVAEMAWLKQLSAWLFYGRLPSFGAVDFFIQPADDEDGNFVSVQNLLPSFVTHSTASSMLFIGRSLNQIRMRGPGGVASQNNGHLSSQLKTFTRLSYPLDTATFSRTIASIRHFLSSTILEKLLPLAKVLEILHLLRDFFLLGRGEFAMALSQQADEKMRSRWRRADNLAHEKRDGLATVVVKEGEVAAVLGKTWQVMSAFHGQQAGEDEGLELARQLIQLAMPKGTETAATLAGVGESLTIASTPFRNLLFSTSVVMTMRIPSPLDLFLTQSDLQTYTLINSYLLSVRRAHLRLTGLWKITALRRYHPPPPGPPQGSTRRGQERVRLLRSRHDARANVLRSSWATASAAIFFLSETEAYFQNEVVAGLWDGFQKWLTTGSDEARQGPTLPVDSQDEMMQDDDIWMATGGSEPEEPDPIAAIKRQLHDPQSLATAHRLYLRALIRQLLLTRPSFTNLLYGLLIHIDHLVALVHRLHDVWASADLEADAGVVDAFVDLEREEEDIRLRLSEVEVQVKRGIEEAIAELRTLEGSTSAWSFGHDEDSEMARADDDQLQSAVRPEGTDDETQYVPRRIGQVDRLLMKLDFGSWFDAGSRTRPLFEEDEPY